jgi:hypothetical protein
LPLALRRIRWKNDWLIAKLMAERTALNIQCWPFVVMAIFLKKSRYCDSVLGNVFIGFRVAG